ncbi:MAG: TetR/AcrR family transcriptional regulator [Deltaproteobacteria bacterium]|nr:TetR/AcrR family transcriptional regulator [Deltaproteobacteria bacterium]RLB23417.1 MAG: TetR family transcriptional regulator [Deltaproteobacteria bacterium]
MIILKIFLFTGLKKMGQKNNNKYRKIISAATRVFAKNGFYKAKVSEIAKEAGIADGTIYIYFKHKDDILIALFEEKMKEVLDNMKKQIRLESDPLKKIQRFALLHLKLIEDNKDMAEIIQIELRQSSKFMKNYHNEKFVQYLDLIGDIIQEGKEKGLIRSDIIPGIGKRAFFGALDEMSRFWVLSKRHKYDIETVAKHISNYFINGIKS